MDFRVEPCIEKIFESPPRGTGSTRTLLKNTLQKCHNLISINVTLQNAICYICMCTLFACVKFFKRVIFLFPFVTDYDNQYIIYRTMKTKNQTGLK